MVSSTLSFAPFFALSPSPSPSPSQFSFPSPFTSRRGLCLVCYTFPQSESQPKRRNPRHRPHWKGKQEEKKRWHWKADAIPDQGAIHLFDRLLAAKNLRQINQYLKDYTKTSRNPYPTIFSLFTRLIQADGIGPNEYSYEVLMHCCARINQISLMFGFLGLFLKEGRRANVMTFSPVLKGLCRDKRTGEATTIVLHKMIKVGCIPNVVLYSIVIDGLCKKGEIEKAIDFVDIMISKGHEPNVMTYNTQVANYPTFFNYTSVFYSCNWKDKALPLSLKFLELDFCDKMSSLTLLSVKNYSSILKLNPIDNPQEAEQEDAGAATNY